MKVIVFSSEVQLENTLFFFFFLAMPMYVEVLGPGIEPMTQQLPKPHQ